MLIISKYKDYYDYFQGIFGIDKTKVYKRENYILKEKFTSYFNRDYIIHTFAINNKLYTLLETEEGIYLPTKENIKKPRLSHFCIDYINGIKSNNKTDVNKEKRQPIVYGYYFNNKTRWIKGTPIMKSFDFHKVMSAKELYIEVETFLGYLKDFPEVKNNQTDKEKIQSHGFDNKNSFRNIK